jgi:hypothetical protein
MEKNMRDAEWDDWVIAANEELYGPEDAEDEDAEE